MTTERELFEAWVRKTGDKLGRNFCERGDGGEYTFGWTESNWQAWQAAKASPPSGEVVLPELPGHPEPQVMTWSKLKKEAIQAYAPAAVEANRNEWQPIETAPKDGRWMLITNGAQVENCYWDTAMHRQYPWRNRSGNGWLADWATHWTPLPPAPGAATPPSAPTQEREALTDAVRYRELRRKARRCIGPPATIECYFSAPQHDDWDANQSASADLDAAIDAAIRATKENSK